MDLKSSPVPPNRIPSFVGLRSQRRLIATLGAAAALVMPISESPLAQAQARERDGARKESPSAAHLKMRPLMRDFMGLNVHTVLFKPDLYKPVCRLLRDFHSMGWDVGSDTSFVPTFPMARNKVDWQELYGTWSKAGYSVDVCLMFAETPPKSWKDLPHDAGQYGSAFARYFGPSGAHPIVESIEIGNEPGEYDDATYRSVFESMARGIREGDPRLRISTCATVTGASEKYAKSLSCVKGLEPLYDIINLHTYAFVEQYPTWRRSYPEDPKIAYLTPIKQTIDWRNMNAPGKEIWVTEFGWDATTKPPPATGDFSKWIGSTETEQAQYLVRSFLVFSSMDLDRAYIYFFNDADEPQLHGSSGITRNFVPKPSFYAVSHLYRTLGDYRFERAVVQKPDDLSVFQYRNRKDTKNRVWAVWSPTGRGRTATVNLPPTGGAVLRAERMPLSAAQPEKVPYERGNDSSIRITVSESPVFLWLRDE